MCLSVAGNLFLNGVFCVSLEFVHMSDIQNGAPKRVYSPEVEHSTSSYQPDKLVAFRITIHYVVTKTIQLINQLSHNTMPQTM